MNESMIPSSKFYPNDGSMIKFEQVHHKFGKGKPLYSLYFI